MEILFPFAMTYSVRSLFTSILSASVLCSTLPSVAVARLAPNATQQSSTIGVIVVPPSAKDHIRGKSKARISVIQLDDLECPACKTMQETLKLVLRKNARNVNLVFRHYPLGYHEYAFEAAEATECAAAQGGNNGFWKFVDALLAEDRDHHDPFDFALAAKITSLDAAKLQSCIDARTFKDKVEMMHEQGRSIVEYVQGVPAVIIYDNKTGKNFVFDNDPYIPSDSDIQSVINDMLKGKEPKDPTISVAQQNNPFLGSLFGSTSMSPKGTDLPSCAPETE